jgi:succinate-semialdehyde dehydrogenase/glutarate-semialdehyde dehydrogenase
MDKLLYINGEWVGEDLEKINVYNPATGEVVGTVPKGGARETELAIKAAYRQVESWAKTTAYERAGLLKRLHQLMMASKESLARLITLEMGKPLKEALGEVEYAASFIEWFAEEGKRVYGEVIPSHHPSKRLQVWKKPIGVVGAITPWNFPAAMLTRKMGPALAAGCPLVIKPSSETPLTALRLIELCEEAGFPKGVVNIVTGSSMDIGAALMKSPKVRKVTFTGSTDVGKRLMRQGADNVKKLSLELGGQAPILIFDDVDIVKAVQGALTTKYRNAGQTCICANRIYVQEPIYDAFVDAFAQAVSQLKVGNGLDPETDIGPLINQEAREKVDEHILDAIEKGASVVCGGIGPWGDNPNFAAPTVLRDCHSGMKVMREETFGPVAPVQKFKTVDEAVELANDTPYGLAAYVFTNHLSTGIRVIERLDYGIIGWNDGAPSAAQAPFGGMKESGMGREGGRQGIEDYLETQYVSIEL